jgi:hypothetical protein
LQATKAVKVKFYLDQKLTTANWIFEKSSANQYGVGQIGAGLAI